MERKKTIVFRPSGPISEPPRLPSVSTDRLALPMTVKEARTKLLSDDLPTLSQGAFELRCLALRGEDISAAMPILPSRLRFALGNPIRRSEPPPEQRRSMRVQKEGRSAKVYLTECLLLGAKNCLDITQSLSLVQPALSDQDVHVRNNMILALGYHAANGGDIALYVELLASRLFETMPMNREAAVWALKQYASRGKMQAHSVFLALGPEEKDDVFASDVRECCRETMKGG